MQNKIFLLSFKQTYIKLEINIKTTQHDTQHDTKRKQFQLKKKNR